MQTETKRQHVDMPHSCQFSFANLANANQIASKLRQLALSSHTPTEKQTFSLQSLDAGCYLAAVCHTLPQL